MSLNTNELCAHKRPGCPQTPGPVSSLLLTTLGRWFLFLNPDSHRPSVCIFQVPTDFPNELQTFPWALPHISPGRPHLSGPAVPVVLWRDCSFLGGQILPHISKIILIISSLWKTKGKCINYMTIIFFPIIIRAMSYYSQYGAICFYSVAEENKCHRG